MADVNRLSEAARAVVREAMQGQPLRLQGLAEVLAGKGCGVAEVKRQVTKIAAGMNVEASPRCPHCHSINTAASNKAGYDWRCLRDGCKAWFTTAETTAKETAS